MLSSAEISRAKARTKYSSRTEILHEHEDCVRIAYEWLDAQTITKRPTRTARPLKHIIEKWAGRYISQSDVEVAAELHPEIKGQYPYFNISSKLVLPSEARLSNIPQAKSQSQTYSLTDSAIKKTYADRESEKSSGT